MLPDKRVADRLEAAFESFKVDPAGEEELATSLGTVWTPQLFIFTAGGAPIHGTIGFMRPAELLAELAFACAKGSLLLHQYGAASLGFTEFAGSHPDHERVPEARFWLGLSEWRRTNSSGPSLAIWKDLIARWPNSTWAARVRWEVE